MTGACLRLIWIAAIAGGAWCGGQAIASEPSAQAGHTTTAEPDVAVMAGQLIVAGFRGTTPEECAPVLDDIRAGRVGGVILFSRDVARNSPVRNIVSPEQVRQLNAALQEAARHAPTGLPLLISVDQEGGRVARLTPAHGFALTRSAQELGATGSLLQVCDAAERIGRELRAHGFNLDFAPVADVNVNPDNPVIARLGRSFSADPATVSMYDLAFLRGLRAAGVLGCLKHFPGHGSAFNDSHAGLTDITDTWSEAELQPYRDLILHAQVPLIMTGHLFNRRLDPDYPATLSRRTLTGLLRGALGYNGVVITDDLQMRAITDHYGLTQAALLAIRAGADLLLIGNNLAGDQNVAAELQRTLTQEADRSPEFRLRLIESYHRVRTLKAALPR